MLTVTIAVSILLSGSSCSGDDKKTLEKSSAACRSIQDAVPIVTRIRHLLKHDAHLAYEIIKYLENENGYRTKEYQIIKGAWLPINENTAAARSEHRNILIFYDDYGEWYEDKSKKPETVVMGQPYQNTYALIKGREILDPLNLPLEEKCNNTKIVIWLDKYIFVVDLSNGVLEITNRGR